MSFGYIVASLVVVAMFCTALMASYQGWGLTSDARAMAQAQARNRSVRTGSVHHFRTYSGGGPGFGK